MHSPDIQKLIQLLSKLPGLGPRSGRRVALYLIKNKQVALEPLSLSLQKVADTIKICTICGNLDSESTCALCRSGERDENLLCVVAEVDDLWAMERSGCYKGQYHVLGGVLSALDGIGPDKLSIPSLVKRLGQGKIKEVIIALSTTVEGQTTAYYVADQIKSAALNITKLAHGVPMGGELDYLDDGTISAALKARRPVN